MKGVIRVIAAITLLGGFSVAQELHENAVCNSNPDRGTCKESFTVHYYYDRWAHKCRPFYFSGCGGNANRFSSERECNATCPYREPVENTPRHRCFQPHDPGTCHADIERWYFDPVRKRCVCR
ncbi:hypothetical protein L596_010995 [Steinernema carpocapsae]|uniref:BPTI/Kunitz inhibitor domain-containing protein n=1 Tax=Steinernema carpocapsae TaxID=34508 RepID=A0A4U5NTC1_STECR|nr:hypothetical protein L596_010995 [Steinernema carpocapsae]